MDLTSIIILSALIFVLAALYASVGHAGASGYLAAMALFGLAPMEMKPAALTLNIFVAIISTTKYLRAGRFSWRIFWPFALVSVPFAIIGGMTNLPGIYFKPVIGAVLFYAAIRFFAHNDNTEYRIKDPVIWIIILSGAALGFVSGLVGVGGGIFLSPMLIMLKWEEVKNVSGIAAAFILVNSVAGLLGFVSSGAPQMPDGLAIWIVAAMAGGYIGAEFGSKRFSSKTIKLMLALVLLIAGIKMMAALFGGS